MEGGPVGAGKQVQVVRGLPEVADPAVSGGAAGDHAVDARREHAGPRLLPVLHSQVREKAAAAPYLKVFHPKMPFLLLGIWDGRFMLWISASSEEQSKTTEERAQVELHNNSGPLQFGGGTRFGERHA